MATILRSPEGSPSDLRSPPGVVTSPRNNYAPNIMSPGTVSKSNPGDVPFFTVAHYQSPMSPTTYEVPVVPRPSSADSRPSSANSRPTSADSSRMPAAKPTAPEPSPISAISPVQLAFGHLELDTHGVVKEAASDNGSSCCHSSTTGSWSSGGEQLTAGCSDFRKKRPDSAPVRGFSSALFSPKPFQVKTSQKHTSHVVVGFRRISEKEKPAVPARPKFITNASIELSKERRYGRETVAKIDHEIEPQQYTAKPTTPKVSDFAGCKKTIYEDATVTVTGDKVESQMSSRPSSASSDQTPRTPKFKSREPSFCLEFETEPQDEIEYLAMLHLKIAEAHERQLLPLKDDLADWISKLLDLTELTTDNLIAKLDNGVILCHLSELISKAATESKKNGSSTVEVPKLPYRVWPRARSGSFFARDNITNFLRFCRRLGVHENLLFETEGLVCGTAVRGVVLCLLEVGRLATLWWGLEAPVLVKLEKELEREDQSSRPTSAPAQLNTKNQNGRFSKKVSSCVPPLSARGPKPVPPPKPASIKAALHSNIIRRPTTFPKQRNYDRGWSGAKTTPVTPAATPTYSSTTRLPVATTPRSSGRSTPNTTPATPTNSRKYLTSLKKASSSSGRSGIPRLTSVPSTPTSSICSRKHYSIITSPTENELNKMVQAELDNKVKDIAESVHSVCNCCDPSCLKAHVRRLSDGKYDIHGRNILVRLLKGKHVMVRVGGGWDTLEHYLLRHSRSEVKHTKAKSYSSSPANYCARERSFPSENSAQTKVSAPKCSKTLKEDRMPSLISASLPPAEDNAAEQSVSVVTEAETSDILQVGCCDLISAPVGENGDFQATPMAGSGMDSMMVSSCPTLDMVDATDEDEFTIREQLASSEMNDNT